MGKTKKPGDQAFEEYYSEIFGGRWPSLKAALLQESAPKAFHAQESGAAYFLDSASVLAAMTLPLSGAKNILDMCAAPGGKSLVIASLMDEGASLKCNERSPDRYARLRRVVAEHFPLAAQNRVQTVCGDGAVLCKKEKILYDAILLDAPCSSERHVLGDPKYLAQWSPARVKSLSMQQWALLSSAYRLLSPGGHLLYSTCALNPTENAMVCGRLLKKFPDARALPEEEIRALQDYAKEKVARFFDVSTLPQYEKEPLGFSILPDAQNGSGPIYFCLFKKV